MDARSQSVEDFDRESSSSSSTNTDNNHLAPTSMERTSSTNTIKFRNNYDALLKEVLEETSEDEDEDLLNNIDIDIDIDTATAELPDELRAALEDRQIADKYLATLKNYMSHRRSHSLGSTTSLKGDYSSPNTPIQPTFSHHQQPKPFFRAQPDPLSRILDAVPYHTRLVNGVQPLTVLEQKFHALRIPELDLPTVADGIIQSRLGDLYKIQDELNIHLHGGPLVKNTSMAYKIGEKKKHKVMNLLDEISKEIGLYEEFVKRAHYLTLESILNEVDSGDEEYYPEDNETMLTDSSLNHFESSSDISRATPGTPVSPATFSPTPSAITSKTPRRISSNPALSLSAEQQAKLTNAVVMRSASEQDNRSVSRQSSEFGTFASDRSPSVSLNVEDVEPWEAFKWTSLKKISDQLYADEMRRHNGLVSVVAVSGVIAIGTTRSLVFVYDYSQNLKCILGDSARAVEIGSVTSLAISADHTTIASGHSQGYIVVWDINKPANPVRIIDPIPASQATKSLNAQQHQQQQTLRKEGHVKGAAILHIGFVGVKKSDIVSGDDQGMAFYHVLYKVVMVNAVDTTRILGRYQNLSFPGLDNGGMGEMPKPRRPSTVFAMQPLPLGQIAHPAENFGLVALLTPYKMIIVGLKPTPQTQYKYLKPKGAPAITTSSTAENNNDHPDAESRQQQSQQQQQQETRDEQFGNKTPSENLAGCLAWLPVMKSDISGESTGVKDKGAKPTTAPNDPMLAFSWGNHLLILRVGIESPDGPHAPVRGARNTSSNKNKRGSKLEFVKYGEHKCRDVIVGLQWINRQILVLITPNEEMILFDPKNMVETERASIRNKQLVYHDRFNSPLGDLVTETTTAPAQTQQLQQQSGLGINDVFTPYRTVEMAYYHSIRAYKGKLFLLGLNKLYIGALLSWADRIIALVRAGDFLEGIELATLFYNGRYTQTVVGLPEDEKARKYTVGEKLKELLDASLNYTFSPTRTYEGMADEAADGVGGGGGAVLFKDLASGCTKACLSMDNLEYLFDVAYERFVESDVRGIFLEVLEPYILQDKVSDIPPAVMKDLVNHYCSKRMLAQLEQIIWHVNPQCLDIDQIVSVCHREGLYEAMMYVWNRSMDDYVSPVVEMLKVIRSVIKDESTRLAVSQEFNHYPTGERTRLTSAASGSTMELVVDEPEEITTSPRKSAEKLFDYFKLILTGRTFPDGLPMATSKANEARSAVYSFVFSGRCVIWPKIGGSLVLTADDDDQMSEPTYPYLRLLLRFSTKKFLEALEIAFEDPWLNGGEDILTSTLEEDLQGKVISRQIIVNTLLDVMGGGHSGNGLPLPPPRPKQSISASTVHSFSNHGTSSTNTTVDRENESLIQLYMFIASNLHKYTTFILLPPTTLHNILVRLSDDHDPNTRQERQAAVQSLLTVYKPMNPDQMVSYYEDAGFWQVLESVYRREKKYGKLVEANLKDDERRTEVFDTVYRLLDERSDLNDKKRSEVKSIFMIRISQFVEIDGQKTAEIVEAFFNSSHEEAVRRLEEDQEFDDEEYHDTANQRVFLYLRGLLEPATDVDEMEKAAATNKVYAPPAIPNVSTSIHERYLELMCRFDPSGVYDYLNTKLVNDVNLDAVLKSCEEYEVIDAVVWIMEKSGNTQGALEKMLSVAKEKVEAILQIIRDHTHAKSVWTFEEQGVVSSCLIGLNGVLRVGTRLCENSSNSHSAADEHDDHVESLWFRLLDSYVESSIEVLNALTAATKPRGLQQHIVSSFKSLVQSILTHLLLSTSPQVSLPRLLSRLIESQARGENTFADFRDIFRSMLDTYKYEGKLLEMTNRLFDRDLFKGVEDMVRGKGRGWRPRRAVCDICGEGILDISLLEQPLAWNLDDDEDDNDESKVKVIEDAGKDGDDADAEKSGKEQPLDVQNNRDIMVFRCTHAYHRQCLESTRQSSGEDRWQCVICHHGETAKEDQQQVRLQEQQQRQQQSNTDEEVQEQVQEQEPPPPPKKESKGKERAVVSPH
ncbi:Golgi CORVET complex core vacuolar protein 8-domain-containing protein [Zychaea mexicana]|uniref:Golgi CORVET complex core vacuolar protein 8-domain-containing protein n=1 Tax=Zychaea mexicana TaxID=64656 RepID=UPI0022FE7B52|nr:Golgi CORVET complex core vacuolar protein 8-domain-containing protein [Zychaea mexicana]KAI9482584.1 Golgi CORVET complex core vacuolar protein 8-domain-containing protein [Zychaea mexicana]